MGLPAHVYLPGIGAGFAASAGFLFASEGPADFGSRGADVHVGNAAIGAGLGKEAFGFLSIPVMLTHLFRSKLTPIPAKLTPLILSIPAY